MPGRLVFQDQPGVIAQVDSKEIEPMAHDFFTPQPIKGEQSIHFFYIQTDTFEIMSLTLAGAILHD